MKIQDMIFLCAFLCWVSGPAYGQSEKTLKSLGVSNKETWRHTGTNTKYLESLEKFDDNGNLVEEIEYESDKSIKKHTLWTYNSNNDKTTETELDASGKTVSKTVYEYNGKLRTSKKVYNEKGKLISWKSYNYDMKEKSLEE